MLPATWKPIPASGLTRVGNDYDGGYVLPRWVLHDAGVLISMGLNADWSFEEAYLAQGGKRVVCFDHTVDMRFWRMATVKHVLRLRLRSVPDYWRYRRFFAREDAEHRLQMIGYDRGADSVSLSTILDTLRPVDDALLKVDIEGWEYRILDQIVHHRGSFRAVVMEFHDIDLHRQRISDFLGAMDGFDLVWLHGNNFGGTDGNGDPIVIEVCLARRSSAAVPDRGVSWGEALTHPNDADRPELDLQFDPA